ncbi:hypothetical protein [Bdellovibrio sp. HCB209]|uniref:hypothetical protein n=1 Tax=Bdellovibrio sp. HCB209 TaxID=3394354 RepID=UPI0039B5264E
MRNPIYGVTAIITSGLLLSACAPDVNFLTVQQDLASLDGGGSFKSVNQSFEVKANADIDVLFVVDNSASMLEEQRNISSKIDGFMSLIKGMNWHVALTTTDPNSNTTAPDKSVRAWGDGQLRPFDSDGGSLYVLKASSHSLSSAQSMLSAALNVGVSGSGHERGIYASHRSIERTSNTPANQDFFRQNSKLVVILISDEDECSSGIGNCQNNAAKSAPENLVKLVQERFGAEKVFGFHSIIKAASDTACSTAAFAPVYESLSKLTGGVIGSVCASDYTKILTSIGTKTAELLKSINLKCNPADANNDGKVDFALIDSKGKLITSGYSVSGSTVSFSDSLPEGSYSASYSCVDK